MKKAALLFSAMELLFVLVLLLLGAGLFALRSSLYLRLYLVNLIEFSSPTLGLIGGWIFGGALLLLTGFYMTHRGIYYQVRMKGGRMSVDPSIVCQYIDAYWKKELPEHEVQTQVSVRKGRTLEICVDLNFLSFDEQMVLLEKAEPALSKILYQHLGIDKDFIFSVLAK